MTGAEEVYRIVGYKTRHIRSGSKLATNFSSPLQPEPYGSGPSRQSRFSGLRIASLSRSRTTSALNRASAWLASCRERGAGLCSSCLCRRQLPCCHRRLGRSSGHQIETISLLRREPAARARDLLRLKGRACVAIARSHRPTARTPPSAPRLARIQIARHGKIARMAGMGAKYLPTVKDQKAAVRFLKQQNPPPDFKKASHEAAAKKAKTKKP